MHGSGDPLDDAALAALVAEVRASAVAMTAAALDELAAALPGPVTSMSLLSWTDDFPPDIQTQRQSPYESQADSIMYRQELAAGARGRGWQVEFYETKTVERLAAEILGGRAEDVLQGPRKRLGPPWNKDHRTALAATVTAGRG